MGTITQRKQKDGTIRYRAEIRINKDGVKFSQSRTFSKKSLAQAWLKNREVELETNPKLLHKPLSKSMTLGEAIGKYLSDTHGRFGRSWIAGLRAISLMPIAKKPIDGLTDSDFSNFAKARLQGLYPNFKPIQPQTLNHDLSNLKAVLVHAETIWGMDIAVADFEKVVRGLKVSRQIQKSNIRDRLPTNDELFRITEFCYQKAKKRPTAMPLHLIIWFAIYSARRQEEITRLRLSDLQGDWWLVRDMKNPNGSSGNHKHFFMGDKLKGLLPYFLDNNLRMIQKRLLKNFDDNLLISCQASAISARFTDVCRILGIDDLHFHDLRHEACTRLAENGLTIPQIQQVSCHDSWASLQRYVNMKPRQTVLEFDEIMRELK